MQYLAALLSTFNLHSINVLHSNVIDFIKNSVADSFEVDDEDDIDGEYIEMMEPFKNVSKIDTTSLETMMKDMQRDEQKQIRMGRSDLGNKLIIHDNTWYIVNNLNNKTEEETDQVDGNACSILLQIGESLITTIAVLLLKNIKKYMKNHKSKSSQTKTTTTNEEKEKDDKENKSTPKRHVTLNKTEGSGVQLWKNLVAAASSKSTTTKRKNNIGEEDQTNKQK